MLSGGVVLIYTPMYYWCHTVTNELIVCASYEWNSALSDLAILFTLCWRHTNPMKCIHVATHRQSGYCLCLLIDFSWFSLANWNILTASLWRQMVQKTGTLGVGSKAGTNDQPSAWSTETRPASSFDTISLNWLVYRLFSIWAECTSFSNTWSKPTYDESHCVHMLWNIKLLVVPVSSRASICPSCL